MKQFVVLLVFLVSFLGLKAQVYPVNVNITTAGQNMPYLSYYGDQNQHLNIFLLLTDFNSGAVDVRLKVKLEGPGFRFETSPTATILPSFNLQPGQPKILTGDAILPYLLEENLVQTSGNGSVNLQKLPEGSYTLCIDVIKDNINADILSTNNCKGLFINTIQPPLLNSPINQDQVDTTATLLSFNWTQPYNYYGAPGLQVNYSWYLYEWVDTTNYNIFFTNQGLIYNTEEIITSKLLSIPSDVYLQNGYHYVWRVRAWFKDLVTGQELDIITNNGYSEPFSFRYGKPVSLLENLAGGLQINLNASALGERKGKALWTIVDESPGEGVSDYTSYIIEYRRLPQEGENYPFEWNVDTVYQKNFDIYQLEPEKTYQVRVSGRLNDYQSPPSDVVEFTTPARTVFACNSMNDIILPSNFQPLQNAYLGQYWQLGQFEMEIIEANKTVLPGRFSGRGLIRHDFLNGARCFVRFTDILVDKEFVVREGEAQAITDGATNWANNLYLNMVTPYNAGGVITSYGWINDSTAFVVVDGVTIPYSFTDPNLPIVVHGEGNVEIQFWPDGTIVVTSYGTQPSSDSLDATANQYSYFENHNNAKLFDKKQYDHFAENYELINCSGGFNYWVPNTAKGTVGSTQVKAYAHITTPGYLSSEISFVIKGGNTTLQHTLVNDTTFIVTLPARSYDYQVYTMYNDLKIGKINVTSLDSIQRNVRIVPLVPVNHSATAIAQALDNQFKAANVHFSVTIDSLFTAAGYNASTIFDNPEVNNMQQYTAQMKAVRQAYLESHEIDEKSSLIFVIQGFTDTNIDGYMVRGRSLGFVTSSTLSSIANFTHTLSHELGHGIGGLEHAWGSDAAKKSTTTNLMDYTTAVGNATLTKKQWDALHDAPIVVSLFDETDDGMLASPVPFRCVSSSLAKKNTIETFVNTRGEAVELDASLEPVSFVGEEYDTNKGQLLTIYNKSNNKFYYSAKDEQTYPYYYTLTAAGYINTNQSLILPIKPSNSGTKVVLDVDCNYTITRAGAPIETGAIENCSCEHLPNSGAGNTQKVYAYTKLTYSQLYNYSVTANSVSSGLKPLDASNLCDRFITCTGQFTKLPINIRSQVSSFKLTEDGKLYSFVANNKEYIALLKGVKNHDQNNDQFKIYSGTYYYMNFDVFNAQLNGIQALDGNLYFKNLITSNQSLIELNLSDISDYKEGEIIICVKDQIVGCYPAPQTLKNIESQILNCNLQTCMSDLDQYMTKENMLKFKSSTLQHILNYLFKNLHVESPSSPKYGNLNNTNSTGNYILTDLIDVFKEINQQKWFFDTYLFKTDGELNLKKLITVNDDLGIKLAFGQKLTEFIKANPSPSYNSPLVNVTVSDGSVIQVPPTINAVIPYYENWFQTQNSFIVKTQKSVTLVKADEFTCEFSDKLLVINQMGEFRVLKTDQGSSAQLNGLNLNSWAYQFFSRLEQNDVDFDEFVTMQSYHDIYQLHPYDFVDIVVGKSIPELNLKEGQKLTVPAVYAAILGSYGEETVNAQNLQIFVGAVAVAASVVTGGASLVTLSATSGTLSITALSGEVISLSIGIATTAFDAADLYFLANSGNANLTQEQLEYRAKISKVAMYLNMIEVGIGGLSALRKVANLGGAVVNGAGSLAQSLTGALKTSYNKLISSGLNAVEQGGVIKFFNAENKLVAEIANNKLVFKYSGFGGDIIMTEGKSTAVFGRFNDPIHGGGTSEFINNSSKVYETGANPNGINILNINDWTWAKNEAWVIESANRGDIIRFISDPTNPTNIFKNGVSGERTVTGLEVQTLELLGYTWDASKFQFVK